MIVLAASLTALIVVIVVWVYTESTNWREDTVKQENVAYCGTSNSQQMLDFYRPGNAGNQNLPVVVYIHGGGWRGGSKRNQVINNYGPIFMRHNIAVAAINYRLNSAHPYPDQNNDIACALTYLTHNAAWLHIDTTKILLFGESAGGELAAYAALHPSAGYVRLVGVVDFYGVSDFTQIVGGRHPDLNARRYLGPNYVSLAQTASPLTYVTPQAPRFLLLHGTNDTVVPPQQSEALREALVHDGINAVYVKLANAGHSFVGPELSPPTYKTILDNLDAFLKDTINR